MLKVSIHAGDLNGVSRFNRLAWIDIAYDKLDAIADYKVVLFQNGVGASTQAPIYKYPRWSGSLWDLVARSIALGMRTDTDCLDELLPSFTAERSRSAFLNGMCAVVDHQPSHGRGGRTLATMQLNQVGRKRGTYTAKFTEDGRPTHVTDSFCFKPDILKPAELLLRASLVHLTNEQKMPPRPSLYIPKSVVLDEAQHVVIDDLPEATRYGFLGWLHHLGVSPTRHEGVAGEVVHECYYARFLKEAV